MAFMTSVARVRAEARPALEAVTHANGTARLQTVHAAHEPTFHALLRAVEAPHGPAGRPQHLAERRDMPIVGGSSDALAFLLSHPVAALVVGDVLITKGGEP
jgi:carbamoyltransferase